jgi:hypothetical protein
MCDQLAAPQIPGERFILHRLFDEELIFQAMTMGLISPVGMVPDRGGVSRQRILHQARVCRQFSTTGNFATFIQEIPAAKGIKSMPLFTAIQAFVPDFIKSVATFVGNYAARFQAGSAKSFGGNPPPEGAFTIAPAGKVGKAIETARITAATIVCDRIGATAPQTPDHPIIKSQRFFTISLCATQTETVIGKLAKGTVGRPTGIA